MFVDEKLYKAYLEELDQVERFRSSHLELYKDTPLYIDDPNIKRMIEALAFFGARARLQAVQKMTDIHQTLFRQHFPYLLNSLPTIAMLQVHPSTKHPGKIKLASGSEITIETPENPKANFQTLDTIDILPLFFKTFKFEDHKEEGRSCVIEYKASQMTTDEVGTIRFHINHLNSFFSSLRVLFAMQRTLTNVSIYFDGNVKTKIPCKAIFGVPENRQVLNHPIERLRSLLHFPQQELFFSIQAPPIEKTWETLTICLNFNPDWPKTMTLTQDTFIPFIVPIANIKTEHSDPIICDGTKDHYPLLYPDPSSKYKLHTVKRAFEILPSGTKTIQPGILGKTTSVYGEGCNRESTYEVNYFNSNLILDIPGSFHQSRTVGVQALWTQPWFADSINDEQKIYFSHNQHLSPKLKIFGKMYPYENPYVDRDPNFLVRIFALKHQNTFSLKELLMLINAGKDLDNSLFEMVPALIKELNIHHKSTEITTGALVEYEFKLKDWGGQKWEVVVLFFLYLHRFLNAWLSHFEIETKVCFPREKKPLIIRGGVHHELSVLARDFFLS